MFEAEKLKSWYDDETATEALDYPIHEYDITSSPNDFNVITLFNFIDRGTIHIPGFQRNFVWDIKRASKLIESLIIGLPIPQIFLYEESRNKFSVIDGQQRLMSIYYFIVQRFPRPEKRADLRRVFEEHGKIPDTYLQDDNYFVKFNLNLPTQVPRQRNKFTGLNYSTLGEYQSVFDLRPIRSIVVKQVAPADDDSAVYEIFNRLNSGGVNLRPQEIRASLYHSGFYVMLYRLNSNGKWRRLLHVSDPDLYMKDVEFILRGFALLLMADTYNSSMMKFMNDFSRSAKNFEAKQIEYLERLFLSFLDSLDEVDDGIFLGSTQRFSITTFESVFVAVCDPALEHTQLVSKHVDPESLYELRTDFDFQNASQKASASKNNVETRLQRAKAIIRFQ